MSEKEFSHTVASGGTHIGVWESAKTSHPTLEKIFKMMKVRGWEIQIDQSVDSSISENYFEGKKGDLYLKSERYPAGFRLEFYQEINTVNRHGGYYDFDKLNHMPYLIRCRFIVELKYISELLISEGYKDSSKPVYKLAMDNIMHEIKDCCHYKEGKELPEYEFESYNSKDKDGKQLRNGQLKYFRDRKGRLRRGKIYHNINNMWWVALNQFEYTNVSSFNFFDITPERLLTRRVQSHQMPQRVRAEKLREEFKSKGFSYEELNEEHIQMLRIFLTQEFKVFNSDMELKLSTPRKKDIKVLKRTGLQYAVIEVDGHYFSRREAITFNSGGFIGFAGWACDNNKTPFVNAFKKWIDFLKETIEVAA